jgi:hypothetical protein
MGLNFEVKSRVPISDAVEVSACQMKSMRWRHPKRVALYRRHLCRLELMLDADRNKLTLPIEKTRRLPDSKA